jgi:hypothetical protein
MVRQTLSELEATQPPTARVYEASVAAAQRADMPIERLQMCVMRRPDMGVRLEAGLLLAKVRLGAGAVLDRATSQHHYCGVC